MADLIRSASLTYYPEVARSVGLDPIAMLRKARLPVACLDSPDLRIAVAGLRRLLEASAAAAGVDEFGLRMADRGGLANLGPVALVVREQATIGDAIEALSQFIHIHHEGMRIEIERDEDTLMISITSVAASRARRGNRLKCRSEPCIASSAPCSATTGGRLTFF